MESHLLKWPDYLILVSFLVISLAIGVYHSLTGNRQRTISDFIMADRRLRVLPTSISLLVSFKSAILILGSTAEMYCYGIQYLIFTCIVFPFSLLIVSGFIVPWLFPLKLISVYEYLDYRFSSKILRVFGACLGILQDIMYMGVSMYAPSVALQSVTNLPLTISVPVMAFVSIAYTALGGMRAVIWTDVFQFFVMISGMLAIIIKGIIIVGGFSNVISLAGREGRLNLANFSFDPRERHTAWSLTLYSLSIHMYMYGLWQSSVQRYSAVKTLSAARLTVLLNIPAVVSMNILAFFTGLTAFAFYAIIKCDPLANKDVENPNQILPFFVMTLFSDSPGFTGFFLAALYGGALSSVSSSLSGSAAICWENILKLKFSYLKDSRKSVISRLLVVVFGSLAVGVAFIAATVPGPATQIINVLLSSFNGPLLGIFMIGGLSRRANWKGALTGGICGVLFTAWLGIGSMTIRDKHPSLPSVSVDGCQVDDGGGDSNWTLQSDSNHSYYIPDSMNSSAWSYINESDTRIENLFTTRSQLHGIQNFYAISYTWFIIFGLTITIVVGLITSTITRNKDEENAIEERLLIRFRRCGRGRPSEEESEVYHLSRQDT